MERPQDPRLLEALDVLESARADAPDVRVAALLEASTALLRAASEPQPVGQCKEADPFAPIYLVFDGDGHRYECTHAPAHSSAV